MRDDVAVVTETPDSPGAGDVLSSLPSSRPQRRSPKRDGSAGQKSPKRANSATKRASTNSSKRAGSASAARSAPPSGARRPVAAQGYHPVDSSPVEPPSSTEILVSAVQAAGEVAQIGLTLGERLLRAAASRLPKP